MTTKPKLTPQERQERIAALAWIEDNVPLSGRVLTLVRNRGMVRYSLFGNPVLMDYISTMRMAEPRPIRTIGFGTRRLRAAETNAADPVPGGEAMQYEVDSVAVIEEMATERAAEQLREAEARILASELGCTCPFCELERMGVGVTVRQRTSVEQRVDWDLADIERRMWRELAEPRVYRDPYWEPNPVLFIRPTATGPPKEWVHVSYGEDRRTALGRVRCPSLITEGETGIAYKNGYATTHE